MNNYLTVDSCNPNINKLEDISCEPFCAHIAVAQKLFSEAVPIPEDKEHVESNIVDIISTDPLVVAIHSNGQYGIVRRRQISKNVVLRCDSCGEHNRH